MTHLFFSTYTIDFTSVGGIAGIESKSDVLNESSVVLNGMGEMNSEV
jgi:hypothetical protein